MRCCTSKPCMKNKDITRLIFCPTWTLLCHPDCVLADTPYIRRSDHINRKSDDFFSGSFLQCSKCLSSTSYDDCQSQVTLTNCSSFVNQSCFQGYIQLIKGADKKIVFEKGCVNSGSCDAYSRGEIGLCISQKSQGYTGDCKGKCCDGENCNRENLLPNIGKNKGSVFIISVMVLLSGVLLTVVNIN